MTTTPIRPTHEDTVADTFDAEALSAKARDHLWMHFTRQSSYASAPVPTIVKGDGAYIWDANGKKYLDGLAGLFVVQAGHGRVELAEAAYRQASELAFFPIWSYAHPKAIELADRLADYAPGDLNKVFFTTGGGEAVETAWKLAKQYFKLQGKPMKTKVISRTIAYHGTPHGALSITGVPAMKSDVRAAGAGRPQGAQHQLLPRDRARRRPRGVRTVGRRPDRGGDRERRPRHRGLPSSSNRCRTPAGASRRHPATSSACARSATVTTCCSCRTRSSAPSDGWARCSPATSSATCPT